MPESNETTTKPKTTINNISQVGEKILKIIIYLTVFCLPLFFLPWNTDVLEFNKLTLFLVLVVVGVTAWLVNIIIKREFKVIVSYFDLIVLAFVVIYILATVFSLNNYLSLVGSSGNYGEGLVALVLLALFYFLIRQVVGFDAKKIIPIVLTLLLSGGILVIFHFFQVFGLYLLPFDFAQSNSFNLIANSVSVFTIFLAMLIPLSMGCSIIYQEKKVVRVLVTLLGVIAFLLLVFLDQNIGWYCLLGGIFIYLIFIASYSQKFAAKWILYPTLILVLSAFFWIFPIHNFIDFGLPLEARLDQTTSLNIVGDNLGDFEFFGSGPQTFVYNFIKYRPVEFNDSVFWSLKFSKAANQWEQLVTTMGALGGLIFLVMNIWFILIALRSIMKFDQERNIWLLKLSLAASFIIIVIASFLLSFNFILLFVWWVIISLGLSLYRDKGKQEIVVLLTKRPQIHLAVSAFFALWCIVAIWLVYTGAKFWLADVYWQKSAQTVTQTEDITRIQQNLERSISLNPRVSAPYFALANNLATQAQLEALQEDADINEARRLVELAVANIEQGISQEPTYSGTYESAAYAYQSLQGLAGYQERIIELNKKAVELEPNNAYYYLNLGNNQLDYANGLSTEQGDQTVATDLIDQAASNFSQASSLKSGYTEAEIAWAWALLFAGQQEQSVAKIESIAQDNSQDLVILYEAGELILRAGLLDKAALYFQEIIMQNPYHSNSHYKLSNIFKQQEKIDLAIQELEIVAQLNPDNETIASELEELKKQQTGEGQE